ncbi:MAG: hypothetical protein ACRDPW_01715 [Mycobacteriales bacterium]
MATTEPTITTSEVVDEHEDEMTYSESLDNFQPTPEEQAWANKVLGLGG